MTRTSRADQRAGGFVATITTQAAGEGDSAAPAATPRPLGTFSSLQFRDYRLMLLGTTMANASQWIQGMTVSWLAYDITGKGATIGTVNLARTVSALGFTPFAGAVVDRVETRKLIVLVNAWFTILCAALGLALLAGGRSVSMLFAFTFLAGFATAIDQPLRQAAVFGLVPRSHASNAVALMQTGWGLMRSIGPAVGGFIIARWGADANFLLMAAIYVLILVNGLRITFPPKEKHATNESFLSNLSSGFHYVAHAQQTRTFVMMGWVLPLFIIPIFVALPPVYAKEVYDGGARMLGILLAAVGFGAVFGGVVAASMGRVDRRGVVQLVALFCVGASLILFAAVRSLWVALPALAFSGFFEIIYITSNQTLLQLSVPDALRGRVTALVSLNMALSPLGAVYTGILSDAIGPQQTTYILAGGACAISVAVYLFSRTVRDYRMSAAI